MPAKRVRGLDTTSRMHIAVDADTSADGPGPGGYNPNDQVVKAKAPAFTMRPQVANLQLNQAAKTPGPGQ